MDVVLDRDAFLKGLQMVHNIVEPRQTLPILANVLLETEAESVRVTATDLEVGARVSIPAKVAKGGTITVSARKLSDMLAQTTFAISHDESRFALNGVLFAFQPKELRLVATDGHRLAVASRSVGEGLNGVTGIVPRKAVIEIARVLGSTEVVQIAITENQFVLQMPNFVMTARLIEGQFPNYEAVLPRAHTKR